MGLLIVLRSLFRRPRSAEPSGVRSESAAAGAAPVASAYIETPAGPVAVAILPGTGRGYFLEVVGESFYHEQLREVWAEMRPERELSVRLTAEPQNPHDPNAVAIQTFAGITLGHLGREDAARYQQLILQIAERGLVTIAAAKLIGGVAGKRILGVVLDVEGPTIVASTLQLRYRRVRRADSGTA
jgi:hypothetical protein